MKKGFLLTKKEKSAVMTDKEPAPVQTQKEPVVAQPDKEPGAEHTWFFIPSGEQTEDEPAAAQKEQEPAGAAAQTKQKPAAAKKEQDVEKPKASAAEQKGKKRRRTRTPSHHGASPSPLRGFYIPGGDEAPKMQELKDFSKGLTNMALAHEIAVDKNFKLQKMEPEDTMEQRVEKMMKKAFWDIMGEQLKNEPPQFDQALEVLRDIKKMIFSILLPQHEKLKKNIDDILDLALIDQQIKAGVFDFKKYAEYVIVLMGQLCAPVHDEQIEDLKNTLAMCEQEITNIVTLFKGITELLEEMKLDMANFTIQQARPLIMNQSVEYEKIKFKEFLEKQEDGLAETRAWLIRHDKSKVANLSGTMILNDAYTEMLEWDEYYQLPETLVMDAKRIYTLRNQVDRVAVSTAIMMICQANFPQTPFMQLLRRSSSLKETMKKNIDILLEDFQDDIGLLEILPRVGLQVMKDIKDTANVYLLTPEEETSPAREVRVKHAAEWDAAETLGDDLAGAINSLEDPNQPLRDLYQKKIISLMKEAVTACDPQANSKPGRMKVPPALMICQNEMYDMAGQFVRLVNYNKSVFGEFYNQIIENHIHFKV